MNNTFPHIEKLIAKHLAGETSAGEEQALSQWLSEGDANREYFNSLQKVYQASLSMKEIKSVDTDAAWLKLKAKIHQQKQEKSIPAIKPFDIKYFLKVAAVFILVTGALIELYVVLNPKQEPVLVNSGNETKETRLPDSSVVFLNKNSSVSYTFTDDERKVVLNGEAFFEIANDQRQFIVMAHELEIKDIGTSFNINARTTDSVEVIVKTGEVILKAAATGELHVLPDERSVYKKSENKITKAPYKDPNILSYKTKIFVFENASLPVVVQKLNEVYSTKIKLSDNLKYCHLTATFKNEKIESILQIIAETLQLKVSNNGKQTVLEGTGCEI